MLHTSPRLDDPDRLFAALVEAHEGLDPRTSRQLDAQLVLLLANHVGSTDTVLEALRIARDTLPRPDATPAHPPANPEETTE